MNQKLESSTNEIDQFCNILSQTFGGSQKKRPQNKLRALPLSLLNPIQPVIPILFLDVGNRCQ